MPPYVFSHSPFHLTAYVISVPYFITTVPGVGAIIAPDERAADSVFPQECRLFLGLLPSTDESSFMAGVLDGDGLEIHVLLNRALSSSWDPSSYRDDLLQGTLRKT